MGEQEVIALRALVRSWLGLWALLTLSALVGATDAFAQEAAPACAVVGRVISIQGTVELRRAGSGGWSRVERLDTTVCAGDELRTAALGRAALFVQTETLVRVDQNTTVALTQTADEIVVEFFQGDVALAARATQSCGAGYFITRFPKRLRVTTPHLNAAVDGTEFEVALQCDATELTVLEGQVRSQTVAARDERVVSQGEKLTAGPSGQGVLTTLVQPRNAVQWVLYYPPLSDATTGAGLSTREQCRAMSSPADRACLTQRAEALLRLGRGNEALQDIDDVLARDAGNGEAGALRAIIQIARNDNAAALQSASTATAAAPNSYRAWLALSYAQQAGFDLEQALASAKQAQALEPRSSLLNARAAELLLSLGRNGEAEAAARAAVQSNPNESRAHTMLGFVHLAQIDTDAAHADFQAAIDLDSFEALPRLGLGLALIRDGDLVKGREQLEIAVALDPSSSLLRSYVGKAYYEENSEERDTLAATQFDLAQTLDGADPTAPFYRALLEHSQTRPVAALQDLERSRESNDGRAVYRSRLLLARDSADRQTTQAVVYNELGFDRLALTQAAESLAVDPGNGAAHRFLADAYAALPRNDIARASELLQSQLRQPLGAPSLQAQLANDVAFRNTFFGPATVGLNEFNPLFIRNGYDPQVFAVGGSNGTYGDQAIVNGLHGPVSFSLSQFTSHTDGYRPNNDDTQRQYDGFLQAQFGAATSAQLELTHAEQHSGDLSSRFDPTLFSGVLRNETEVDTQRLSLRRIIDSRSDLLVSIIRQDRHASADFPDPFFPFTIIGDVESRKVEAQYLRNATRFDLVVGTSYFDADSEDVTIDPFSTNVFSTEPRHVNAYGYVLLPNNAQDLQIQLGLSYDDLTSDVGDQSEVNPKIGVIWKPMDSVTLRAAVFRVLKRRISSDQGLEPTQVAGFNQFFDDQNGAISESAGLAADFRISRTATIGVHTTHRNVDVPFFDFSTNAVSFARNNETTTGGYFYWVPSDRVSVSVEPEYEDFEHGFTFNTSKLTQLPTTVRLFFPSGWWMGVSVTGVKQEGEFTDAFLVDVPGSDDFWLVDAMVAYRLPRRLGTISLQGTNLFDQKFQFQETDVNVLPRFVPEARVVLRVSIGF